MFDIPMRDTLTKIKRLYKGMSGDEKYDIEDCGGKRFYFAFRIWLNTAGRK